MLALAAMLAADDEVVLPRGMAANGVGRVLAGGLQCGYLPLARFTSCVTHYLHTAPGTSHAPVNSWHLYAVPGGGGLHEEHDEQPYKDGEHHYLGC